MEQQHIGMLCVAMWTWVRVNWNHSRLERSCSVKDKEKPAGLVCTCSSLELNSGFRGSQQVEAADIVVIASLNV